METLSEYIAAEYGGNMAAFSRDHDVAYEQVQRRLKKDCIWHDGEVWEQRTTFNEKEWG